MQLIVNGEPKHLPSGRLADLLAEVGAEARGVAVAVDGEVVPRSSWAEVSLRDGQHVEIVHAVQGG